MNNQPQSGGGRQTQIATLSDWHLPSGSGVREVAHAFMWALLMMAPILWLAGSNTYHAWRQREDARLAQMEASLAFERLIAAPPGEPLPLVETTRGRDLFVSACVACHGPAGKGIAGLGKDLTTSTFVAAQSDEKLHAFLITGRPEAWPVGMPPRAGREDLTDDDLSSLVLYVRGLQDPRRMPELPAWQPAAVAPPTEAEKSQALAAAGGDAELAGYIASGTKLFNTTCIACHGKEGVGMKGSGKTLVQNEFVKGLDDDSLLAFIKKGRDPGDPKNTTGVAMPPKGGNPALSDDDLLDIISYLRTLRGDHSAAGSLK